MRMMSTLLIMMMSSHMAFEGIIPVLLLKILLLKGRLLLGPPMALGAFVIGHGSGLLIGKLLGIDYLLDRWYGKRPRHKPKPYGWKFHPRPKRPKLIHRLRWVLKGLFHRGWKEGHPPMFHHPPEYYIKHYDFDHHHHHHPPPHEFKHVYSGPPVEYEIKSHHYPGPPPDLLHSYSEQPHSLHPPSSDWKSERPGGYKTISPGKSKPPPNFDEEYDAPESHQYHGGYDSKRKPDLADRLKQLAQYNEEESYPAESDSQNVFSVLKQKEPLNPSSDDLAKMAEQLIIEEFLRPKQSGNTISEDDKNKLLAKLLERQFALEYLESTPDKEKIVTTTTFKPFPGDSAKAISNATNHETTEASKPRSKKNTSRKDSGTILTPLWNMVSKFDPTDLVPDSVLKWMFDSNSQEESDTENNDSKDSSKNRRKREVAGASKLSEEEQIEQLTDSFLKDVKNLFTVVSFLDINQCLEKMVCDVHTKANDPQISTYESNLVSAFKVMDAIMPSTDSKSVSEDSSTKYRRAARLGQITRSNESCRKAFSSCSMESDNIISLGNIASFGTENASEEAS